MLAPRPLLLAASMLAMGRTPTSDAFSVPLRSPLETLLPLAGPERTRGFRERAGSLPTALGMSSVASDAHETTEERQFNVDTALFCAGLAFDAYVEPDPDSSRWERGSKGMNVAFVSSAFTRNLYTGMVEVTPIECTDLPEDDDTIEKVASGDGVDACLMCAVVEGSLWKEDLTVLDKESNHNGIFSLSGSAHVGRSRTAWANVNVNKSNASKRKTGRGLPYHVPKAFLKPSKAIWPEDERPFYLYVQDPANVRLVVTLYDDDVIGDGSVISSTSVDLRELMPKVGGDLVETIKNDVIRSLVEKARATGEAPQIDASELNNKIADAIRDTVEQDYKWEGELKMTTKPKLENKNGQMAAGAAAGAMVAGPIGAAAGAAFGAFYEGPAKGQAKLRLRYLPVPPSAPPKTDRYEVLGGMPGITWGELYEKKLRERDDNLVSEELKTLGGSDLEFCFFINHDQTGATVGVYRSLEEKRIVVSFRGTCQPIDLLTDASIFQVPWVEGDYDEQFLKNVDHENFPMVHVGFRKSMDSISRRLKTLVLGSVGEGESISDYEVLVTGHSLGGALATLFTADIAESGIDAGRSLPQKAPSEPWWKGIASTLGGKKNESPLAPPKAPPRPKSLKMYNFGSPRAGNSAFAKQFDGFLEKGYIDESYRIVNSQDIIARVPRPTGIMNVDYEHCGKTVLIEEQATDPIWIEGESDFERIDPVRDVRSVTKGILSEGMLLDDLVKAANSMTTPGESDGENQADGGESSGGGNNSVFSQMKGVADRLKKVDMSDLTSLVGIDKSYSTRELELAQSFLKGESLAHHMEDSYYLGMGRAVGYNTTVGEEIVRV
ncbi:unnamed protein product [Pseudo-nitzschia multistriata]|uniref:Fungal lipase-type domain-containing protein n=1 Tax=Pseudo-nitzschia multistriata TaxID=183589 RepID=A0A448ZRY5_9STRA|nr:unnamed protein product [Pseudo-nitzschia multistriata]